jgi:hypothetical protein
MMEALSSPETSVLTRATRCNIPQDAILYGILVLISYDVNSLTHLHVYNFFAFTYICLVVMVHLQMQTMDDEGLLANECK